MCGIVGYAGRRPGKPIILDGLRHLEYRGYDSAGIALLCDGGIDVVRSVGNLDALIAAAGNGDSAAVVGLGHTRWATHGRPSHDNAHPHDDCTGRISIVLNGIIENYKELRAELAERRAHAHLRDRRRGRGPPDRGGDRRRPGAPPCGRRSAASTATTPSAPSRLDEPQLIVGTRHEAPLVVGLGDDEAFIASAIPAFLSTRAASWCSTTATSS